MKAILNFGFDKKSVLLTLMMFLGTLTGFSQDFTMTAPFSHSENTCSYYCLFCDCNITGSDSYSDITYLVTIPCDGTWTFSLCGATWDTKLAIGTSECAEDIGYNDDYCGLQSEITVSLSAGTYWVDVDGYGSDCGSYTLNVTTPAPSNDLCSGATSLAIGASTSGCTAGASPETQPYCGTSDGTGGAVWYSFTGNGNTIRASLCGSSYDTKVRVYSGSCGALVCEGGNDDACGLQSQVDVCTIAGTTYYVLVHGYSANQGAFTLSLTDQGGGVTYYADNDADGYGSSSSGTILSSCGSPPSGYSSTNDDCDDANNTIHPGATEVCDGVDNNCDGFIDESPVLSNDDCSGAITLAVGGSVAGNTYCATVETLGTCGTTDGTGGGVWYTVTAQATT